MFRTTKNLTVKHSIMRDLIAGLVDGGYELPLQELKLFTNADALPAEPTLVEMFEPTFSSYVPRVISANGGFSSPLNRPGEKLALNFQFTWTATAVNEVQVAEVVAGSADGGTFTIARNAEPSTAIAWNETAAGVVAILEQVSDIGVGNVSVAGTNINDGYTVTFKNALGFQNLALLTLNDSLLTGTGPIAQMSPDTDGAAAVQGGGELIHGYWLSDVPATAVLAWERFESPVPILKHGDSVTVNLFFALPTVFSNE